MRREPSEFAENPDRRCPSALTRKDYRGRPSIFLGGITEIGEDLYNQTEGNEEIPSTVDFVWFCVGFDLYVMVYILECLLCDSVGRRLDDI